MKRFIFVCATLVAGWGYAQVTNGIWTATATGNWSNPANWQGGNIADGVGAKLTIASTGSGGISMSLDGANGLRTVGAVHFNATRAVTMNSNPGGDHSLRLDNGRASDLLRHRLGGPRLSPTSLR